MCTVLLSCGCYTVTVRSKQAKVLIPLPDLFGPETKSEGNGGGMHTTTSKFSFLPDLFGPETCYARVS